MGLSERETIIHFDQRAIDEALDARLSRMARRPAGLGHDCGGRS